MEVLQGLSMASLSVGLELRLYSARWPKWLLRMLQTRRQSISRWCSQYDFRVPLAGGQYSMVSEYAPEGSSNFLAYVTGQSR